MASIAPDAEVVTVVAADAYERGGRAVDADAIDPEAIWFSLDSYAGGLMGSLVGRTLKSPAARWVQVFSAGIDAPIFRTIMEKGLRMSRSSAQAIPIAEYVVAHALSLQVPIEAQAALQRAHTWKSTPYRELARTRWVLIGYGNIGREIAKRINPFGVDLTVVRHSAGTAELADRTLTLRDLPNVLPSADVVVLAPALNDETRGMCDEAFFQAMKPGSILLDQHRPRGSA